MTRINLLLLVGIAIRLPALLEPVNEGYRNAQTACLTARMFEEGHIRLDPIAPWRGDLDARLALEFPIYNLAALSLSEAARTPLDRTGRGVSLIFWILSFIALQALWRRTLPENTAFWANLLFVFAPMNLYLSTAFMPESLLQLLAVVFMVSTFEYARTCSSKALAGLFITGLLGLLVKFPSFVHLGLFTGFVFVDRLGWKPLFRPALIFAGLTIALIVLAWGEYVKTVNAPYFAEWSGLANLVGFIRPEVSRLAIGYWLPLVGYNAAFITTLVAVPFVILGFWTILSRFRSSFKARIWSYLLLSLFVSWLVWGKGAPAQHYYNLPNLVLFSAAFGIGVMASKKYLLKKAVADRFLRRFATALAILIALFGLAGYRYLSRPDLATLAVAEWVSHNLPAGMTVAYQPRHSPAVIDYQHQPLLSHLTGRRTWILVRTTPGFELEQALTSSQCLIVTHPDESVGFLEHLRRRFKGPPPVVPPSLLTERHPRFRKVEDNPKFSAYLKNATY